ncbi:putative methyltransferase-like protein 25 [Pseudolycoriella hygida]|uniref:Methyltransferase-like protein 25 n=1 Tax=Pseudolycoriella hygida TaxID=35572 RepID=A0A9Q0S809_9DIPT|nr:putative methyltransferase-like protein 25 [Pseudolycoriella hygida]
MSTEHTNQSEPDINDVFDDIVFIEEKLTEQGYSQGFEDGQSRGNSESFHLGYHRGSELGAELGYYYGITTFYLTNKTDKSSKVTGILESLKLSIEEFPQTNDENCDIFELANGIRAQFRKACTTIMISTSAIQTSLDGIIKYLNPFTSLISCHMVNYITEDHWKALIPPDIRNEIRTEENIEEAINIFWDKTGNEDKLLKYKNFVQFIEEGKKYTIDGLAHACIDTVQLRDTLNKLGCSVNDVDYLKIKEFMSEKKNHEVEKTAKLVSTLCKFCKNDNERLSVIEAGDGKGYLSSRLALEYKLRVLGIDASLSNTENALKRSAKLEKAWTGLTKRAEDIENGIIPTRRGRRKNNADKSVDKLKANYKTTTLYITPQTDFGNIFNEYFPQENSSRFCLSGLHTCGNLASSCLKIFVENCDIDVLCNIGCCYHLLGEEFCVDEFFDNRKLREMTTEAGFPMSNHLKSLKFKLGRNARMLASQSTHRTIHQRELPQISLFYRAVLETIITEKFPHYTNSVQVGRSKKTENFIDYVRSLAGKTQIDFDSISDEELIRYEQSFQTNRLQINLFYLIRMTFASVLETLILLDRLLYLREANVPHSFLVKLFDPILSPRCFAVVALKT